ncbi:MAG TPA: hypothetical protein VGB38_05945, partial [bacterium]
MNAWMKWFFIAVLGFSFPAYPQEDAYLISQTRRIKFEPVFQSWKLSNFFKSIQEFSTPVELYYPFNRQCSMTLSGGFASGKISDTLSNSNSLSGLNDAQAVIQYQPTDMNFVLSLGLALPSGKKELTLEEFNTMASLSQNMYRFETPVFGQGFCLAPGVTYAWPVSETVVLGLGASYQIKSAYTPIDIREIKIFAPDGVSFQPGNELFITAGADFRLGEAQTISADILWTHYDADKVNGEKRFQSGNRLMLAVHYQKAFGYNAMLFSIRYRNQAKSRVISVVLGDTKIPFQPNEIELTGIYNLVKSERFSWKFSGDIRLFQPV